MEQFAPCHLPNIDQRLDQELYRPDRHSPCEVCQLTHAFTEMILCDRCNSGWHTFCMNPSISKDIDSFICSHCQVGGFSPLSASCVPNLAPVLPPIEAGPIPEHTSLPVLPPGPKENGTPKTLEPHKATPSTRASPRIFTLDADHLRCTSYHNIVVARTGEEYQESEILWGKVAYMGKQALPCALSVRFQNGKVELMNANQVAPILCEEGIEMPELQVIFATVIAKTLQQLPPAWVLNTTDKVHAALRSLMPSGNFRKTETTANSSRMPGSTSYHEDIRVWGRRGPPQVVFDQLKRVLRLDDVISWTDPCASTCQLAKLLISPKYTVRTNETYTGAFDGVNTEAQFKLDPTQPSTFQKW